MGAIEAVRNHIHSRSAGISNTVLTVLPGYWRARESVEGLGFKVVDVKTECNGFAIDESELIKKAYEIMPTLVYLSLPNNPTGALFDPALIIKTLPEATAIMIDFTLPSAELDSCAVIKRLHVECRGRANTFFVGSTSKSHGTAELRIGWAISCNIDDAQALERENRVVIASFSIEAGIKSLGQTPTALERIRESFSILNEGERSGRFEVVRPPRGSHTSYTLIKLWTDADRVKKLFDERRILVMWGASLGLSDEYIRLDLLEPPFVRSFVETVNASGEKSRFAS
jgi:aspartate/methionine/tyrosine aminotransferase